MRLNQSKAFDRLRNGAVLLTVNRRLSRALRRAFNADQQARGLKTWATPEILPWDAWVRRTWLERASAHIVLSPLQEELVWDRIIASDERGKDLLNRTATVEKAAAAWALVKAWQLPPGGDEWTKSPDYEAFQSWAEKFETTCARNNWVDQASIPDRLAANLRASASPPVRHVILAGFDELTPQQAALLECLKDRNCQIDHLAAPEFDHARLQRAAFRDAQAEITAAARWARALLESGERKIAVLCPDLESSKLAVYRIFEDVLQPQAVTGNADPAQRAFNISLGDPLIDQPLIRTAFLILELGCRKLTLSEASSLIRSPFLKEAESEMAARATFDAELRGERPVEVDARAIRRGWRQIPGLARRLRRWTKRLAKLPGSQAPAGWSACLSDLLGAFSWPGDRTLNSTEYQALEAWKELLCELPSIEVERPSLTYAEAVAILKTLASRRVFQPETAEAPVQILGLLETSGLDFDHVWILGLHDGAWPRPAKPNPFIPRSLQKEHQLPRSSPSRELAFARSLTAKLRRAAPDVVVSYPEREGDCDLRPSPLILDIPAAGADGIEHWSGNTAITALFEAQELEAREEAPPPPVNNGNGNLTTHGTRILELQAACPFRAFAEVRLGAEGLESGFFGLDPMERGHLIHRALENVWRELKSHEELCSRTDAELEQVIESAVSEALARSRALRDGDFGKKLADLEKSRLTRLIKASLELEKQRSPFTVLETEGEREIDFHGLRLRMRLDRVDALEGGREIVVDHKITAPKVAEWMGERPDKPQIPLYAITHDGELAAVIVQQMKPGKVVFRGVAQEAGIVPGVNAFTGWDGSKAENWEEVCAEWRANLGAIAESFLAGDSMPDPKRGENCRDCGLAVLCRRPEREQSSGSPEGGRE